ncbi:endonuclease/exonuclease/phosphatase family protein [Streptomyces sp. NPDC094143]|uniref:endonuclease/exonuclease/phosphatase family protein n=1 Tax=Streptomyces sp. NPDC094143 TaxID=3155310 RepID=UPI003333F8FC
MGGPVCEEAVVLGRCARWLVGVMTVVCMVLVGPSAPSGALLGASLPVGAVKDVVPDRVMTWNICNPCDAGDADRAAAIAAYAPQVIGMQEACVRDVEAIREHLKNLHGLVYHVEYGSVLRKWGRCGGAPWSPGAFGQAILSAAPMTDAVSVEYPDGGSEDRGYMAVTTTVDGEAVRVFNTHLAQRRQETVRAAQVRILAAAAARHERAVLIGDFNAVPGAPELTPVQQLAVEADSRCRPPATGGCEPTTDWQLRFDYVFLRGITALGHRVQPSPYSDHHIVYADLDTEERPAA